MYDILYIKNITNIKGIQIFDITGKKVESQKSAQVSIDVSNLPNGLFFIKIETKAGIQTQKFLKVN